MQNVQPLSAARLPNALLTIQTVCAITGLDRKFIFRATAAKNFPQPVRIGNSKQIRWRASDVSAWATAQKTKALEGTQ